MTATLISLISILVGIIGANSTGFIFKKYSFGSVGNTIAGVFGSILFVKSFGRLGLSAFSILQNGTVHNWLLILHCCVSFLGGSIALILISKLKHKINHHNEKR